MSTFVRRIATRARRFSALGVLLLVARDAWSITISPSPSYTGSYTVSFARTECYVESIYYVSYVLTRCTYLEERAGTGVWTMVSTPQGATSVNRAGKAPGTYTYQVYVTFGYGDKQIIDGPASVTVGTAPPRDPLVTQLGYQFQTRKGDINADGRTDLFVKRTAGGVAGNGVLDAAILRQGASGGAFSVTAPTAYESSLASTWPLASTTVVVSDFNVDGFVDVEVKGVAAATKVPGASDQIVFSSGIPFQPQPLGVRAVDAALKKFVANMLDYIVNPDYFSENADLRFFLGTYPIYFCRAPLGAYSGILDRYDNGISCPIYNVHISGYYWDYREFSSAAVAIWTNEEAFVSGSIDGAQSTERAQQTTEAQLGVQIGGWPMEEELGTTGEHTDAAVRRGLETFWAILGIGRANAQEVATVEAPPQIPRLHDVVYITGRKVLGVAPGHTAIEYTSAHVGVQWVSAFGEFVGPRWTLVAYERALADAPRLTLTLGQLQKPGKSNAAYFLEVTNARRSYRNNLCYTPTPSPGNPCYNSNGFTRGVIAATGGIPTIDLGIFPGGNHPVPANELR
jgi:hypothetical protein